MGGHPGDRSDEALLAAPLHNGAMNKKLAAVIAGAALALTGGVAGFLLRGTPAAAAPTHHLPPVACEGYGATSFCHVTVASDGTEYLFDEDRNGTIILITQTPPK